MHLQYCISFAPWNILDSPSVLSEPPASLVGKDILVIIKALHKCKLFPVLLAL